VANEVVVTTWGSGGGAFAGEAEDVLTLGREVAAALGGELVWLQLGAVSDEMQATAGRYGVAHVDRIEDPKLAEFAADVLVEAVAQYAAERSPRVILFAQGFDVRLIAPRVAARAQAAVVMNATGIDVAGDGALAVTATA